MTKTIRTSEVAFRPIQDASATLPQIDPSRVQQALGAEDATERLAETLSPVTLFALRQELMRRLQSSGGRPALVGTTRRAKIPLRDEEWQQLEELASAIASPGFAPSAGQVASVLLRLSLDAVATRIASGQSSLLARELLSLTKHGT